MSTMGKRIVRWGVSNGRVFVARSDGWLFYPGRCDEDQIVKILFDSGSHIQLLIFGRALPPESNTFPATLGA